MRPTNDVGAKGLHWGAGRMPGGTARHTVEDSLIARSSPGDPDADALR